MISAIGLSLLGISGDLIVTLSSHYCVNTLGEYLPSESGQYLPSESWSYFELLTSCLMELPCLMECFNLRVKCYTTV